MAFNPAIPQPGDLLSDSQNDLLDNNTANNTWSMVDHYALDDMTPNNGFHTHVTSPTPVSGMHYATALNTLLYGMQDNAGIGNLQYSRGPNNAVPGPVTTLQSSSVSTPLVNGSPQAILQFNPMPTPIPPCYGIVTASALIGTNPVGILVFFVWPGSGNGFTSNALVVPGTPLSIDFSGSLLQISNSNVTNATLLAWTLRFERIWATT